MNWAVSSIYRRPLRRTLASLEVLETAGRCDQDGA